MGQVEGVAFRPAARSDVPAILELISRIYGDYGYVLDIALEDTHLQDPCEYFRHGGGDLWVADVGGAIGATTGVVIDSETSTAEIKTVYVAREYRRRGFARSMTNMAIEHARAKGCTHILLWSDTCFHEAHKLYESLGFQRTGYRTTILTNSFQEYRYERSLLES